MPPPEFGGVVPTHISGYIIPPPITALMAILCISVYVLPTIFRKSVKLCSNLLLSWLKMTKLQAVVFVVCCVCFVCFVSSTIKE